LQLRNAVETILGVLPTQSIFPQLT
jgi:hypothetical protein